MCQNNRIGRGEYFLDVAKLTSKRSTCPKKQVGAVLTLDNRIIATGYNGVLPNQNHEDGIDEEGVTHTVHAEANIIAFCARHGIKTEGAILWTTLSPCDKCAELIIQSGIKEVSFIEVYRETSGLDKLVNNGVIVYNIDNYEGS